MTDSEFETDLVQLAPQIRRYCARLTGSLFDGDDLAQDALALALQKRTLLRDGAPVKPWLFRIAHNKCVDFLRARARWQTEDCVDELPAEAPAVAAGELAFSRLVYRLPPRQRAMLLLRDLFGLSLEETAAALACSIDAVKSGTRRARNSLQAAEEPPMNERTELDGLVARYAQLFNDGDWDNLVSLLHEEVQMDVATVYSGFGLDKVVNRYCTNYSRFDFPWCVTAAHLPSGECALSWRMDTTPPSLLGATRFRCENEKIVQLTDYLHDPHMLEEINGEIDQVGRHMFLPATDTHVPERKPPDRI